jgi:hypothetical protein
MSLTICTLYVIFIRAIKLWRVKWAGQAASMRELRNTFKHLVGKPRTKRPIGRPSRRWE